MRLDEWQRYIDSEFLEEREGAGKRKTTRLAVAPESSRTAEPPSGGTAEETSSGSEQIGARAEAVIAPEPTSDTPATTKPSSQREFIVLPPHRRSVQQPTDQEPVSATVASAPQERPASQPNPQHTALAQADPQHVPAAQQTPAEAAILSAEPEISGSAAAAEGQSEPAGAGERIAEIEPTAGFAASSGVEPDGELPPFAAYIAIRREAPRSSASQTEEKRSAGQASLSLDIDPPAQPRTEPAALVAISSALQALFEDGEIAEAGGVAARRRRAALKRRILDPVLSLEETALLLGLSGEELAEACSAGTLAQAESASRRSAARSGAPEPIQRGFRLSDIVRHLEWAGAFKAI